MALFATKQKSGASQAGSSGGATAQAQAQMPGSAFDMPGIPGGSTQWSEQDDTTTNVVTTISPSVQVPIQNIQQYRQTDVVLDWLLELVVTQTYTQGAGQTLTSSPYAPYNVIGPVTQLIQNQYASVTLESGIDLYIFNLVFPQRKGNRRNNNYANPAGSPIGGTHNGGYLTATLGQPNLINPTQWTPTTGQYKLYLRLPASQWFDKYYDLAVTGQMTMAPHPAVVSPQYMAGTTRVITPQIKLNQGFTTTFAQGPVHTTTLSGGGDTASTFTGSAALKLRRRMVYAGAVATQPPVYAWQIRWKTQRFGLSGVQEKTIQIPLDSGQVLFAYVRLFDPLADSGLGAPIGLTKVKRTNLQYGSGLFWWDGTAAENQATWLDQHGFLLPEGVIAYDLSRDERDVITNARALNTLTTAGILIRLTFTTSLSADAYAVLGVASLVYVT